MVISNDVKSYVTIWSDKYLITWVTLSPWFFFKFAIVSPLKILSDAITVQQKFQPSAHLSTNHSTALQYRLYCCVVIGRGFPVLILSPAYPKSLKSKASIARSEIFSDSCMGNKFNSMRHDISHLFHVYFMCIWKTWIDSQFFYSCLGGL